MQLRYQPAADRLLWQLRTTGGELWIVGLEEERGPGPGVAAHTAPAAKEVR